METDEMELDTIGDRKTALFVIISDTDDTFNFVVSILYTQLFNLLCDKADDEYGGRLPVHVRCLLDEFANIGQIPKFEKLIATIRSREISASIILQSQSQLKAIYKDNADTLPGGSYPFVNLREANTLLRKLFTSRKSEKNVRQHSGTQKGAIEAITSIHTGYMIRAPTFRRGTQRQEPHPLQLNTAAPQDLRSAGTAAFTRGRFFCAAAYADRLLSACRTAADAAERIYLWHFSIAQ